MKQVLCPDFQRKRKNVCKSHTQVLHVQKKVTVCVCGHNLFLYMYFVSDKIMYVFIFLTETNVFTLFIQMK